MQINLIFYNNKNEILFYKKLFDLYKYQTIQKYFILNRKYIQIILKKYIQIFKKIENFIYKMIKSTDTFFIENFINQ